MDSTSIVADDILRKYGGCNVNDLANLYDTDNEEDEPVTISHSPYHSTEDMLRSLEKFSSDFTVLTLNAQSINSKFPQIQILIHQLTDANVEIGAICIQETWVPPNGDTSQLQLDGFKLIPQGYSCTTHGGLFIYVNEKYTSCEYLSIKDSSICEALFIKVSEGGLTRDIIIGNVYKPPHNNNNNDNIEAFITAMQPKLEILDASNLDIFCAGDFNIDLLKTTTREYYSFFLDMMIQNSCFPKITLPTRFSKFSCSLLDNIF